jgi:sulfur carrier protein
MQIWINGQRHELSEPASVTDALAVLGVPSTGVAVAVNGEVVPRAGWPDHQLSAEAQVEVLTAVQGG